MVIDRTGKVGIGTSEPKQLLDVAGNIRTDGPYIFINNNGFPQLVLSNADGKTKRFGVWRSGSIDRMTLGPQAANGGGTGAIFIYRDATIEIPRGGLVKTVLSNDKFDKEFDDKFFIQAADRLKQKGLIRRVGVVDGKLTIM